MKHGVYVQQQATSVSTPVVAPVGIPFVIGAAPVQSAAPAPPAGTPVLCTNWDEAVARLGYSDDWRTYNLCEFMYAHFNLYGCQPVIFCNLLDPESMKTAVPAADVAVTDRKAFLPAEAVDDDTLVVLPSGGAGSAYVKGTDYGTYYDGGKLVIEMMPDGAAYGATAVNVACSVVNPSAVTPSVVAAGLQNIEKCLTATGIVPDLICAPGYSEDPVVAAVMATKAAGINGIFRAKALVDISSAVGGAVSYDGVLPVKTAGNLTDENQILCWPMLALGDKVFHMSTHLAGLMAQVDTGNGGCPFESPSNKAFKCNAMVLDGGGEVTLTLEQANTLNANGVVTALCFMGSWVCWGNYTACYPLNTDVKDYFIPVSRMFDWVGNTVVRTFWSKLDKPMRTRLIENIMDTCNIWLGGLVGFGYILGARVEAKENENPLTDLMAGVIRVHIYVTPPSPAQEIDFLLEYDISYVKSALGG